MPSKEPMLDSALTHKAISTIKTLAMDAVQKANSGHPGMPMGAADYSFILWNQCLRYSAAHPDWPNRDRFVLSAGHGCMLLYSLLHLAGFDLTLDEIQNFRQWKSKTPGHPEVGLTPGVEATTGPLGQGVGNGVGMALAAKMMEARFNREDFSPIDHYVYAIVSDGDLMEGVASEAASLAGHLKLSNLIYIYDDNHISIDGQTEITFSEDVAKRFEAYGWFTQKIDGHAHEQIIQALDQARAQNQKPSLILARTHIAKDAHSKQDTAASHGAPLGEEEVQKTKENLGWPKDQSFLVPNDVRELFQKRTLALEKEYQKWREGFSLWREKHPDLAKLWDAHWNREIPSNLYEELCQSLPSMPNATRSISSEIEQKVAEKIPGLVGGSADLASSTKTNIKNSSCVTAKDFSGRNFCFGIREHGMGATLNGLALYGGWIPLGSTFLQFSDYMRPSIRLAALSDLQVIYIFTHDSIFLGEDGPTHQPIEHLGALRLIPNLTVVRPADALECAAAWQIALSRKKGPTAFSLSRQKLPYIERDQNISPNDILKGGYIACGSEIAKPQAILIATGSELYLAAETHKALQSKGISTRVVSMPCLEVFVEQDQTYQQEVLSTEVPTAVIEAAQTDLWHKWIGKNGLAIGIHQFGASAPAQALAENFGFTTTQITQRIQAWLKSWH